MPCNHCLARGPRSLQWASKTAQEASPGPKRPPRGLQDGPRGLKGLQDSPRRVDWILLLLLHRSRFSAEAFKYFCFQAPSAPRRHPRRLHVRRRIGASAAYTSAAVSTDAYNSAYSIAYVTTYSSAYVSTEASSV